MERLHKAGFKIIPVTAGSAGWSDLIANMGPVDAIIGESWKNRKPAARA
jgi:hypothetical protein